jgi:hypothetical protein
MIAWSIDGRPQNHQKEALQGQAPYLWFAEFPKAEWHRVCFLLLFLHSFAGMIGGGRAAVFGWKFYEQHVAIVIHCTAR